MPPIRGLEEQFDPAVAARIKSLQCRLSALRKIIPGGATKYYLYEMHVALEAGALLAVLHLASSSVELFLRAKIVETALSSKAKRILDSDELTHQEQLEEDRKSKISDLLERMVELGIFRSEDQDAAIKFYQTIRTPLAHGLLRRFTHGKPHGDRWPLFDDFTKQSEIEHIVEDRSLDSIELVVNLLERNATYNSTLAANNSFKPKPLRGSA